MSHVVVYQMCRDIVWGDITLTFLGGTPTANYTLILANIESVEQGPPEVIESVTYHQLTVTFSDEEEN